MKLVYICGPGEGPEPKKLGGAFAKHPPITPGVPWECKRPDLAKALLESLPGKIVEFVEAVEPAEQPAEKPKKNKGGDA